MQIYPDIAGRVPRPSTRATRPAHPEGHFGKFGKVRHEAKGRWAELAVDIVRQHGPSSEPVLVISTRHSEEPTQFNCATLQLDEAAAVVELLTAAIATVTNSVPLREAA